MKAIAGKHAVTAARWSARLLSVLLLGLMIVLLFGHLGGDCAGQAAGGRIAHPAQLREMALGGALFTILVGLVLAWRWEGLGSLLILGGFTAFTLVNWSVRTLMPYPLHNPFFGFLVTGLLFALCWWRGRKISPE